MSEATTDSKSNQAALHHSVQPNRLCRDCKEFWQSADCLRKSFVELIDLYSPAIGRDNHVYQIIPRRDQPDYYELHRSRLYANGGQIIAGKHSGCHNCALIPFYFNQDSGSTNASRRSPRLITADQLPGAIVAAIVLLRRHRGLDIESYELQLVCCEAIIEEDGPDEDWIRVGGSDLTLCNTSQPQSPPVLQNQHSCWSNSTDSPRCCDLIISWLNSCRKSCPKTCSENWSATLLGSHPSGAGNASSATRKALPTRLLDLAAFPDNQNVRLIETAKFTKTEYLTLSYTWGGYKPFMLEKDNYQNCLRSLDTKILPKVCQQAITITRKLGFRYLWIDAVCIIQDDADDWRHESARMDSVFAGSTLTLAASSTVNCHQNLYAARDPLEIFQLCLQDLGLAYQLVPGICSALAHPPPPLGKVRGRGLDTRGWVYQERALSPRTVHFMGPRLHWECRSRWICEGRDDQCRLVEDGSPKNLVEKFTQRTRSSHRQNRTLTFSQEDKVHVRKVWATICSKYGSTALTHWTDRQQAFAGLLRFLQSQIASTISYGFCLDFGVHDLLWYTLYPNQSMRIESIPTWSWMSLKPARDRWYNLNMRHLLVTRHNRPETMIPDIPDNLTEVAKLSVSPSSTVTLEVDVPMIGITELLKHATKNSATQWTDLKSSVELAMSAHFFAEAGFLVTEDFSQPSMRETEIGVLFEGVSNRNSKVWYCLLVRRLLSKDGMYTRVGVVEVEWRSGAPDTPARRIILLV